MQAVQRLLRPAHRYEKVSATELVPLDQSSLQHAVVRGCAPSGLGMWWKLTRSTLAYHGVMMPLQLSIKGMTCSACTSAVEQVLG
jgi:hypothetical protein